MKLGSFRDQIVEWRELEWKKEHDIDESEFDQYINELLRAIDHEAHQGAGGYVIDSREFNPETMSIENFVIESQSKYSTKKSKALTGIEERILSGDKEYFNKISDDALRLGGFEKERFKEVIADFYDALTSDLPTLGEARILHRGPRRKEVGYHPLD